MNAPFDPSEFADHEDQSPEPEEENILDRLEVKKRTKKPRKDPSELPEIRTDPPGVEQHFRPLGYDRGRFFFFTAAGKQIRELTTAQLGKKTELIALAGLDWWEREFATDAGFTGRAVDMATNYLVQACYLKGVFSIENRRGRGVWRDLDNIVIHAGDRLYVDGVETALVEAQTEAVYECQQRLDVDMRNPLTPKEAALLLQWAQSLNWECRTYGLLLIGWTTVAIAGGALNWRPHIFLNSMKGSGKSSILDVIQHLLHGLVLAIKGETSAAGIRQTLQADALPVVFDEIEGDTAKSSANVEDVLAMMRTSSSNFDAKVIKGGADGRATATQIRSCFCLAAIRDPLHQAADQSRVTVLSLRGPSPESRRQNDEVTKPLADQVCAPAFASRFRARVLSSIPALLETIQVFTVAAGETFGDARMGDQIGALMGGAWVALRDGVPTLEEARERMARQTWSDQRDLVEQASDEEACLRAILEAHIKVDGSGWHGDASIGELVGFVEGALTWEDDRLRNRGAPLGPGETNHAAPTGPGGVTVKEAERALAMYGVRVEVDHASRPTGMLLISNTNGMLGRKVMNHTTWAKGWGKLLARLPGAKKPDKVVFIGGHGSRCVAVPIPVETDVKIMSF